MSDVPAPIPFRFAEFDEYVDRAHEKERRRMDALNRARALGTLNQVDRSRQYTEPETPELLRSLNEAWSNIRRLESAGLRKDTEMAKLHAKLGRYKFANIALISVLTGLAWEGLKALVTLIR